MATKTVYGASLATGTCTNPGNATGAPDGVFTGDTGGASWTAAWRFTDPAAPLTGTQSVSWVVRGSQNGANPATYTVNLYDGPTLVRALATGLTALTATTVTRTFSTAEVSNPADVRLEFVTTGSGGQPAGRESVQLDAITWDAEIVAFTGTIDHTLNDTTADVQSTFSLIIIGDLATPTDDTVASFAAYTPGHHHVESYYTSNYYVLSEFASTEPTATIAVTLGDTVAAVSGVTYPTFAGDLSATLGDTVAAVTGEHYVSGDLAASLDDTTAFVDAHFSASANDIDANLAATLEDTTASLSGVQATAGDLAATTGDTTAAVVAAHGVVVTSAVTLDDTQFAATATQSVAGDFIAATDDTVAAVQATRFPAYWIKIAGTTTIQADEASFYVLLQVDPDSSGGWWFDEVRATVNGGPNQLAAGTFNSGDKTGWTQNTEQDGVVVDPGAAFDPPGAYTLQIDADGATVQQQGSDSFAVTEGDVVYVEAWAFFYGGVNANGKVSGKTKNATGDTIRTAPIASTTPLADVVTGEVAATLEDAVAAVAADHGVEAAIGVSLDDTVALFSGDSAQAFSATLSAELDATTAAVTGEHYVSGDLAASLDDTQASVQAELYFPAVVAATLDDTAASFAVTYSGTGTLAATLDDTALSAQAVTGARSDVAATTEDTVATSAAVHGVTADAAISLEGTSADISARLFSSGTLAATLDDTQLTATGTHYVAGDLGATLDATVASGSGVYGVAAQLARTLDNTEASAEGTHSVRAVVDAQLDGVSAAFAAEYELLDQGVIRVNLDDTAAQLDTVHGAEVQVSAVMESTSAAITAAQGVAASVAAQVDDIVATVSGAVGVSASLGVTLEDTTALMTQRESSFSNVYDPGVLVIQSNYGIIRIGGNEAAILESQTPGVGVL